MKKLSKYILFMTCAIFVGALSFSTFAANINSNSNDIKRERPNGENKEDLDMVIGKITNISADNITIEVATRKEREKKSAEAKETTVATTERKAPTMEERYVLTGETKTFNIASADLGRKAVENANTESAENAERVKGEKLTYLDYKIGDYVRISTPKETPTIAKRMRSANQGFNFDRKSGNYQGGYKGSYTGKTKAEKEAE